MKIITDNRTVKKALTDVLITCRHHGIEVHELPDGATIRTHDAATEHDDLVLNFWWQDNYTGLVAFNDGLSQQPALLFNLSGYRTAACLARIDGGIWLLHTGKVHHKNSPPTWEEQVEIEGRRYYKLARIGDPNFVHRVFSFYRSANSSSHATIASESEIAPDFATVELAINQDFALEGMGSERFATVRHRVARIANRFIEERQTSGALFCDECSFNPSELATEIGVEPRGFLDAHHKNPLAEGSRRTTTADFSLLCPTCHRIEHLRLRTAKQA
ncbi:hypothetical protein [Rhodopseudomonas sp.]|uniref:hypothetical protein n=1 Tax=Rhodopseudomonas sp. TaxID=1078 RepID=UPI0039E2D6CB